jgi:hypothetical protein
LNDIGFAQFSAGGTELLNDVGAFNAGNNFCVGAWKKTGPRSYDLVHRFFIFDGTNAIGVSIEQSHLTLSRDGNRFRGIWTQDNYDLSGKLIPGFHFDGTKAGTRIAPGRISVSVATLRPGAGIHLNQSSGGKLRAMKKHPPVHCTAGVCC